MFCGIAYYVWAEVSKSLIKYRSKNNFVKNNFIENNFDNSTKLFPDLYLAKFLDTSTKSSFRAAINNYTFILF